MTRNTKESREKRIGVLGRGKEYTNRGHTTAACTHSGLTLLVAAAVVVACGARCAVLRLTNFPPCVTSTKLPHLPHFSSFVV